MDHVRRLGDMCSPIAQKFVAEAYAHELEGESHSCRWTEFLPLLYKGFRLHLDAVLDLCIGLIVKVCKQSIHRVSVEYEVVSLSNAKRNIKEISKEGFCENCAVDWIRTIGALNNHGKTALNKCKIMTALVLGKHGFKKQLTVDNCFRYLYNMANKEYEDDDRSYYELAFAYAMFMHDMDLTYDSRNCMGQTILHFTAARGCFHMHFFNMFLRKCASVNVRDDNGNTPLHLAISATFTLPPMHFMGTADIVNEAETFHRKQFEKMRALLDHGASVNDLNNQNDTPLMLCLNYCFMEFLIGRLQPIRLLLYFGSLVNHPQVTNAVAAIGEVSDMITTEYLEDLLQSLYYAGFDFSQLTKHSEEIHEPNTRCQCKACSILQPFRNGEVRSLFALCVFNVRNQINMVCQGCKFPKLVDQLDLPAMIKESILLRHELFPIRE